MACFVGFRCGRNPMPRAYVPQPRTRDRQLAVLRPGDLAGSTDHKERREQTEPVGTKPGHEGHSRVTSSDPDAVVAHRPHRCICCGNARHGDLPVEVISVSERIERPAVTPIVTHHWRLAVKCPTCGARCSHQCRRRRVAPRSAHGCMQCDASEDLPGLFPTSSYRR